MTNHDDTGHIPTTFPVDANLTEFPINTSLRMLDKIEGLATLGEQVCTPRKNEDGWAEMAAVFQSIMDDAQMLNQLFMHYHRTQSKPAA